MIAVMHNLQDAAVRMWELSYAQTVADSSISLALLKAVSVLRPGRTVKITVGGGCRLSSEADGGGLGVIFFHGEAPMNEHLHFATTRSQEATVHGVVDRS